MGKHIRRHKLRYIVSVLVVILISIITIVYFINKHKQSISQTANTDRIAAAIKTPSTQPTNFLASDVVTALNQQRSTTGISALHWITQLDNAAQSRANYDVANNTVSNTQGSPGADITDTGYSYSNYYLADIYDAASTQDAIKLLISSQFSDVGDTTNYSDIGVSVVPDTIKGNATQLIVIYFANQASTASNSTLNSNPAATVPYYCDPLVKYYPNGCPTW